MANKGNTLSTYTQSVESLHLGNKSSNIEDELVTWLQYPLDYTLERGYCSEIFGKISSLLGKANLNSDQGVPISMENGGTRGGVSTVPENAKNALALGAGRASGYVVPDGAEAFTRVKTLMPESHCRQANTPPCKGSRDLVLPSPLQMSHEKDDSVNSHTSIFSQGFANVTLLSEKYPAYGVMHNFPANNLWASASPVATTQGMESLQLSKAAAAGSTLCQPSSAIISKDLRKGSDAHTQVTHTQGSSYSLITEDHARDTSFSTVRAGDWGAVCPASYDADTSVRLTSLSMERQWQETFGNVHVEVPDVVPSCSGGSQTSAEMSPKETSSMGKQKLEDYDCQSKNAEVDSADTSQPHRRPSKRSRVAESHNLSEKRRRNRINEKLKTLQELIPNSSKTDKASILDEAIEYLKALQSQLQMMSSRSGMRLSPMVVPAGMQHIPMAQMAPVHPMGLGLPLVPAGMGMGVGMGLMDLTHGMDGRQFQAHSGTTPHFNLAHPALAPLPSQICGRSYANMEVPSSEFWPLQQPSANGYQQVYDELQAVSSVEVHQKGEQLSTPRVSKDK